MKVLASGVCSHPNDYFAAVMVDVQILYVYLAQKKLF
jgi:hypothetical protein